MGFRSSNYSPRKFLTRCLASASLRMEPFVTFHLYWDKVFQRIKYIKILQFLHTLIASLHLFYNLDILQPLTVVRHVPGITASPDNSDLSSDMELVLAIWGGGGCG